jgi:hypothetical protein
MPDEKATVVRQLLDEEDLLLMRSICMALVNEDQFQHDSGDPQTEDYKRQILSTLAKLERAYKQVFCGRSRTH